MKIAEIKDLSCEELAQLLREKQNELRDLRLKHNSTEGIEMPRRLAIIRKDIAQIQTIANQKAVK